MQTNASTADDVQRALLGFVRCFGVSGRGAVYVSSPITTGHEYLQWMASHAASGSRPHRELQAEHRERVMLTNIARAEAVVANVRQKFADVVIDPTVMPDVDGWVQSDYHRFWVNVIEEFVHTVVFVDGWQYSSGAALEFAAACRLSLDLRTQNLHSFDPAHGLAQLREASAEFRDAGIAAPIITDTISKMDGLPTA